jgi:hypothetical protein
MRPSLVATAFTFEGRAITIGQVVLAALHRGDWAELEREVAISLAHLEHAEREDGSASADAARRRLVAWRRERQLLSAEDYHAWLADRGLTLEDMSGHLRRAAALELATAPSRAPPEEHTYDVNGFEVAGAVYQAAILTGRLSAWTRRLTQQQAARRALRARAAEIPQVPIEEATALVEAAMQAEASGLSEVPVGELRDWAAEVMALEGAWSLMADQIADPELIERCLRAHQLEWQRLEWEEVTFAREDVARETGMWVRDEGLTLAAVAAQAGADTRVKAAYGVDAVEFAGMLSGRHPGELIGPLATEAGWLLVQVRGREPPSAADPELRARAVRELLDDALAPHLAGRVEWHARL